MTTPAIVDWDADNSTSTTTVGPDIGSVLDSGAGAGNHSGFLILICTFCDGAHDPTIDDGNYTKLFNEQNASVCSMVCFYKAGVNGEVDPVVTIGGTEAVKSYSFSISSWDGEAPLFDATNIDGATNHIAPTVTATKEALVLRFSAHRDSNITYSTIPETTLDQANSGSLGSTQIHVGVAYTTKNNEATGTATFVSGSASDSVMATIVIQSTASGGPKIIRNQLLLGSG